MDAPEMRRGYRDRFVSDVEKHSAAISNGESATANKMHKRLHKLYSEVKEKSMTDIFPEFFVSDHIPLRFWSAVFSLKTAPEKSIQVLTAIADTDTITAPTARITIQLWKEGKLELL